MIRDRGKIKWHSAFFMPEHVKMLKQLREDDIKQQKPQLDEHEFDEIEILIKDSLTLSFPIKMTIWDYGYFFDLIGIVRKLDMFEKKIILETDLENRYIEIDKITRVKQI